MTDRIYLSRRNLLVLLSKLDRVAAGEDSACTIVKYDNAKDRYRPTLDEIEVIAVEDEEYYGARLPGVMYHRDEENLKEKS